MSIIQTYSGWEATLWAFLLLWSMAVLAGCILLFFRRDTVFESDEVQQQSPGQRNPNSVDRGFSV
jgi:uncharacterized membrane protein YraQ (UPF0718 family)